MTYQPNGQNGPEWYNRAEDEQEDRNPRPRGPYQRPRGPILRPSRLSQNGRGRNTGGYVRDQRYQPNPNQGTQNQQGYYNPNDDQRGQPNLNPGPQNPQGYYNPNEDRRGQQYPNPRRANSQEDAESDQWIPPGRNPGPQSPQDQFYPGNPYVPDPNDPYRDPQRNSDTETRDSELADNRTEWERAMQNDLQYKDEIINRLNQELQVFRSNPPPPMIRSKSIYDLGKEVTEKVDAKFPHGSKFSMLPAQQQQVENMAAGVSTQQKLAEIQAMLINLAEATDKTGACRQDVQKLKNGYLHDVGEIHHQKKEIETAKNLASKFHISLEMPTFDPPPYGFRRDPLDLDFRHVQKFTGKFTPGSNADNNAKFCQYWEKVILFGKNKYFTEAEYIDILGYVLHGEALTDMRTMVARGASLGEIANSLAALYDDVETIDDHKHKVDNFTRLKDETISKTMARAKNLIHKLAPLHSRAAWPEKSEDMGKSILKQVVAQATRVALDMEEQKMIRAGANLGLNQMIDLAFDHEKYNKLIPTKEVQTTYQVASMTPKSGNGKDEEKAFLRKELSLKKIQDETLAKIAKQQEEMLQIAAANYGARGRSADKFAKSKFGDKPEKRSLSWQRKKKPAETAPQDEDDLMQFEDSPVSADKQQGQVQKKPYQPKTQAPQKQQWYKDKDQQQQQKGDEKPKFHSNNGAGILNKNGFPKTSFKPKMFEQNGYHYFQCACTSWHLRNTICPLQMPSNVIQMTENDYDDEEENEVEDETQEYESEN